MSGPIHPLPQYAFMAWCLVKYRDNFTFTFMFGPESIYELGVLCSMVSCWDETDDLDSNPTPVLSPRVSLATCRNRHYRPGGGEYVGCKGLWIRPLLLALYTVEWDVKPSMNNEYVKNFEAGGRFWHSMERMRKNMDIWHCYTNSHGTLKWREFGKPLTGAYLEFNVEGTGRC
jgi:hypothetical protein